MKTKLSKSSSYWWIFLLEGGIQLLLGILLLVSTDITVFVLIQLLGVYWLIRGLIMIIQVFIRKDRKKGWLLFGGIMGVLAGILVLRYPIFSSVVLLEFLVAFIALVGLIQGTISFAEGIVLESVGEIILGILLWIICLLLFFNPVSAIMALPVTIGIIWVIGGFVLIIAAFNVRR